MISRIGDRMTATRRQCFVGRENERAVFQHALAAPALPFQVLYVFGPGGIGKTTLIKEFAALAEQKISPRFTSTRATSNLRRNRSSMPCASRGDSIRPRYP
jgi:ABC-type transport system involved in cytochrome c biogenesis ATPase subunit